ncbi:hypothetical protein QBA57_13050 [Streptomyces scabiei]|uniref:hypothetical protein n=1 Tax=Streptomyces scabiei TaxID=1930 RepID=UPI0007660AA1|nr:MULTISPECIES: hypothetical protein [Streptomyces]MBP5861332.1 hypothetical protein [Streptomyces sp. LBUM 1484]MBP5878236.1 hypothetical protein [Streptomyces sp. LBUM 1477]MBP5886074.1 hypothetical protein [Streptomyces sp. LBUM 1487]MBP5902048.1 hypothetical protein [Streptomyces sp. LBUM 1488]MDW8475614.1 hypothetical protein [Streptomyces scabiei]
MTGQDHVTVIDPRAPVNNGEGHQYVFYSVGGDWMIRKGVEPLRIAREDRMRLADRFVPPRNYGVAADRLEKPGSVVLLEAPPGSGRRAAAIMLMHRVGEDRGADEQGVRFEELPVTGKDENPLAPGEGDRFLLDLSGIVDEEAYAKAQRLLAVRRSQVQDAGAHMVVVLPSGMGHAHAPGLGPHTVTLGRPRGVAVVTRYLRMDRMAFRPADLESTSLQRLCDRSPMQELARFAGLVRAARDSGRFGVDFAGWLDQAMHAVTDRAGEVGRQVISVRSTPERALLLATAMFEEAGADVVYEAWHNLMRTVRHEEEATTELARADFGERLAELGIERAPDGQLRFERLAYADAVRAYFWANFPGVRDDLKDWVGHAAGLRGLTTDDRVNVIVRFGEQCLGVGRPDHLFDLAVRWADNATGVTCDPRAVTALELGLSHERLGGWFRKRIYKSVSSSSLPDGLARVLTVACLQSLVATHPDQAMVRLHYLAVRKGEAAREAREALLGLAGCDRRLYRLLIDRLRDRTHREPHHSEPHLRLLTELLSSDRAPDPPPWPDLFLGWEAVFSQPPTKLWNLLVISWLSAAEGDSAREMALSVMVGATHGRTAALQRLYVIACSWVGSARHPSRAGIAALFWQHIDHARYARTENAGRAGARSQTTEETR